MTVYLPDTHLMPQDSIAPLSWFDKQGYYVVDGKIFRNKIFALQEATRKNLQFNDIHWIFNNDVFGKIDWKSPWKISLLELYRMRAQQLREKYDYLVLMFSGGGDSTNILDSFILNTIHLDEVLVVWPRNKTAGKYVPCPDTDATNMNSEWDYLIEPKLRWLQSTSPRTKITLIDILDGNLKSTTDPDDIIALTAKHTFVAVERYKKIDELLAERDKKYKNYAAIIGIGSPMVLRFDRHFFVRFSDAQTIAYQNDFTSNGLCRNIEFFYWTPDLPEIAREQAHALLDNLSVESKSVDWLPSWKFDKNQKLQCANLDHDVEKLRRWIKQIIYPTYNHLSLQVDKPQDFIRFPEWQSWFYKNPHAAEIIDSHYSMVKSHQNLVSTDFFKYKNNCVIDYTPCFSKLYHIGDLP